MFVNYYLPQKLKMYKQIEHIVLMSEKYIKLLTFFLNISKNN